MMRRLFARAPSAAPRPLAWLVPLCLLTISACGDKQQLPPGNWIGRCQPPPEGTPVKYGPPPERYVRDEAKVLLPDFTAELERTLSDFQRKSCHQLSVVTTGSLDGATIEDYGLRYANRVGLGYRGLNNGVMLLLAHSTRQARIQIGCGLEDVISDQQAAQIMQRDLLPGLRDGDPDGGIRKAVAALMALASTKTIDKAFRPDGCLK